MNEAEQEILTYDQFMLKQRVRVSFDFDVYCNSKPICNSRDDDEAKQYELALLKSFLVADKEKLLHMMVDGIATQIGLNRPETFVATFFSQIDTNCHVIFGPAIDALRGDAGDYWREARDEENLPWGDVLSLATEKIFECFSAEFVSSSYEIIGEQEHDN